MFSYAHTVEQLVAHVAFETLLMPLGTGSYSLFGGIDGLAAARAFGAFWHGERHDGGGIEEVIKCKGLIKCKKLAAHND